MNISNTILLSPLIIVLHSLALADQLPWTQFAPGTNELDIVLHFLPENPVILEAGARNGEDTLTIASRWPKATIYAFEPHPVSFKKLSENTQNIPSIKIYELGLAPQSGPATFYMCPTNLGASSFLPDAHIPLSGAQIANYHDTPVEVTCINLDEWATNEKVEAIDYMWLDMEGFEYQVLNSAPHILSTVKAISCELNFREFRKGMTQCQTLKTFLESQGFVLYKICGIPIWNRPVWQATGIFIRKTLLINA